MFILFRIWYHSDNLHCLGQTNDMFQMIAHLSKELEVNNYYAKQEQQLTETIDNLKQELEPLENVCDASIWIPYLTIL